MVPIRGFEIELNHGRVDDQRRSAFPIPLSGRPLLLVHPPCLVDVTASPQGRSEMPLVSETRQLFAAYGDAVVDLVQAAECVWRAVREEDVNVAGYGRVSGCGVRRKGQQRFCERGLERPAMSHRIVHFASSPRS